MLLLTAVVCGFCLDALLGDPQGGWHPIVVIGKLIGFSESRIRKRLPKTE